MLLLLPKKYDIKLMLLKFEINDLNPKVLISKDYQLLSSIKWENPKCEVYQIKENNKSSEFIESKKNTDFFLNCLI